MKKKIFKIIYCVICSIIILISSIVIDFSVSKITGNEPLLAIKKHNKKEQYYEYYGVFYKMWICTAEENNYKVGSYKDEAIVCPKLIKFNKDGSYTNFNNLKITKEEYELIKNYYNYDLINSWTKRNEIEEAVFLSKEVDEKKFITKEGYYVEYNGKNYMIAIFNEFIKIGSEYYWKKATDNLEYHYCVKYNDDKTKYLFSKFNGNTCDGNFKELEFSSKWCETIREDNKIEIFKNIYDESCL